MSSGSLPKPKADRLREGMEILRKLQEVGVAQVDPGFQEVKAAVSAWVNTGEPAQHRIILPRLERVAELMFPRRAMNVATCVLKVLS
jgi:hypothetical protein